MDNYPKANMCSSIKVFIPKSIYNQEYKDQAPSYLYGHIRQASVHSPTTFYIINKRSINEKHPKILPIGEITDEAIRNINDSNQHEQFIRFTTNILHQNILLVDIQCTEQQQQNASRPAPHAQIVLFDLKSFQKSAIRTDLSLGTSNYTKDDIELLQTLLQDSNGRIGVLQAIDTLANVLGSNRIVAGIRCCCASVLSQRVIKDTAVARHFERWRRTFIVEPFTM